MRSYNCRKHDSLDFSVCKNMIHTFNKLENKIDDKSLWRCISPGHCFLAAGFPFAVYASSFLGVQMGDP